ncbi:hypothetical protein BST61_g9765 [Cercospora zeina]
MKALQGHPLWFCSACIAIALLLLATFSRTTVAFPSTSNSPRGVDSDVMNTTLGFEKILVVNMPERHDKRDAMAMSMSFSGIDFEWHDGINGSTIIEKAKPPKLDAKLTRTGPLGSWRAHMNAMQRIVKDRIQSALIIEDDTDWDVNIKQQLNEYARGARFIQEYAEDAVTHSPYGDDWDVLWLGHCGVGGYVEEQRLFVVRDDPTVVPPQIQTYSPKPNMSPSAVKGSNNRLVYRGGGGRCIFAYAVSLRGARMFLYLQTMAGRPAFSADRGMAHVCDARNIDARYILAFPTLFGTHMAAGPTIKDSDRTSSATGWREVGETADIVFSTRLNFPSLMGGRSQPRQPIKSQWPNETMIPDYSGELEYPQGEGVFVKKEDYIVA